MKNFTNVNFVQLSELILRAERIMIDLYGFIDLITDDVFRIVDIERNVNVVGIFVPFGFLLPFINEYFGLLFVF
jgi:hypothetical protein